jgi:outer membrane protein insertion porin family
LCPLLLSGRAARVSRVAGLALITAILFAVESRAQSDIPSELKTISAVRFEGRHHVSAKALKAVLKTRKPSIFPWRRKPILRLDFLRADTLAIENVYWQNGYLDARAQYRLTPSRKSGSEIVTFVIQEGRQTRIAAVELLNVRSVPEAQVRKRLLARPGRHFNPLYLGADTTRIATVYKDRGYLPHITPSAVRDSQRVTVRYDVEEGQLYRYGQVYFSTPGELHVDEKLIRRELLLKPGNVYRASQVQLSIERLYQTGLFSQVQMTPLVDSSHTLVEFDLRVLERKPRWIDTGVGSGSAERFRFTGEWGHRNVARRGMQGALSSRVALDGQARFLLARGEASLLDPWFLRSRTREVTTLYYEVRHDRADVRWLLKQEAKGVSFQLRRELGRFTRTSLTQDNAWVKQDVSFRDPNLTASERDSLARDFPPTYSTHRIQLGVDRDTRDDPIATLRGSLQNLSAEIAGGPFRGTSSFAKGQMVTAWYTPTRKEWVVAARLRGGTIVPYGDTRFSSEALVDPQVARVPLEDRFRIGGVNSLRGYDENEIPLSRALQGSGGLTVVQANLELRVPIVGPFGAEFFIDAGNVWTRPEYLKGKQFIPRISSEPMTVNDVRYTFGAGARVQLPFGPLRVDFTWGARPEPGDQPGTKGKHPKGVAQFAIGPSF